MSGDDFEIIAGYGSVAEGGDAIDCFLLLCPIGEQSTGQLGWLKDVRSEETELIAAAGLVSCDGTGDPSDLNITGDEGENDAVNGGGAGGGVECDHRKVCKVDWIGSGVRRCDRSGRFEQHLGRSLWKHQPKGGDGWRGQSNGRNARKCGGWSSVRLS